MNLFIEKRYNDADKSNLKVLINAIEKLTKSKYVRIVIKKKMKKYKKNVYVFILQKVIKKILKWEKKEERIQSTLKVCLLSHAQY